MAPDLLRSGTPLAMRQGNRRIPTTGPSRTPIRRQRERLSSFADMMKSYSEHLEKNRAANVVESSEVPEHGEQEQHITDSEKSLQHLSDCREERQSQILDGINALPILAGSSSPPPSLSTEAFVQAARHAPSTSGGGVRVGVKFKQSLRFIDVRTVLVEHGPNGVVKLQKSRMSSWTSVLASGAV